MKSLGWTVTPVLVFCATYLLVRRRRRNERNPYGLPLPPGPPRLPLIGNAHQILGKNMITVLDQWAKEYGPIVYIKLFGRDVIVLNTTEVGTELLENRHAGKNYTGRPNSILASTAMQGDMMMPFIHSNDRFRRVRKLVTTELRPTAVTEHFNPVQTIEVHRLVNSIIQEPEKWELFVGRCMGSILTTAVYDKPLRDSEAGGLIRDVIRLNDELINAIDSGQNYVDFLPFLQYVPGVPYKARAASYYELAERTYKTLMDEAKANYDSGKPAKSVAARLLESQDNECDYREQYWALAAFYLAGSDTQAIASQSLILALTLNPHIMKKAQAEVDLVVGSDRCPTYADEPSLPYIKAMTREALRWRPPGPTGLPHASIEDDSYKGYYIPGGSMVLPNVWTMHMDPNTFDHPEVFEPQRYVDNPNLPLHAFGFGRRGCPGRRLAEQTLFLEFATIAWALNVRAAVDPNTGEAVPLNADRETAYSPVGLMRPKPFSVSITPRSAERAKLLERVIDSEH